MIFNVNNASGSDKLVHLLITCNSLIAGATVTATNGSEVHTATAPSGGGVVSIDCKALGIWTITENKNNTSATVTAIYYGNYEVVIGKPDGSTATPVNDIQTWLACAGLNKSYTTINQVLDDSVTLSALISDNNASDYLARSTDWISSVCANESAMTYIGLDNYCANKLLSDSTWCTAICNSTYFEKVLNVKVPTMTSNTTPYGIASCISTTESSHPVYMCFDGNDSTYVSRSTTGTSTQYVYKFVNSIECRKLFFKPKNNFSKIAVQYSDDDLTYTSANEYTNLTGGQNYYLNIDKVGYHLYWKLIVYTSSATNLQVYTIQFYGRTQ